MTFRRFCDRLIESLESEVKEGPQALFNNPSSSMGTLIIRLQLIVLFCKCSHKGMNSLVFLAALAAVYRLSTLMGVDGHVNGYVKYEYENSSSLTEQRIG